MVECNYILCQMLAQLTPIEAGLTEGILSMLSIFGLAYIFSRGNR